MSLRKTLVLGLFVLVVVLVGLAIRNEQTNDSDRRTPPVAVPEDPIRFVDGLERYQSNRASDWVAHADYVAVIKVVAEKQASVRTKDPILAGAAEPIARLVEVRLGRLIWSAPNRSSDDIPPSFLMGAAGWFDDDKPGMTRTAWRGTSRFEVGHTYVVALQKVDHSCDGDGNVTLGDWSYFGTGGVIPFDDGVLGAGEFQGSAVKVADFVRSDSQPDSIRQVIGGKTLADLGALLRSTKPTSYTAEQLKRTRYPCRTD